MTNYEQVEQNKVNQSDTVDNRKQLPGKKYTTVQSKGDIQTMDQYSSSQAKKKVEKQERANKGNS